MNVTDLYINITSEDPTRLYAFYKDVVGLPLQENMGEFALKLGPAATLGFDGHSDTHGRAKEPSRILIDLWVEDIVAAEEELKSRGVTFFRSQGREYWGGIISTFEDPDGNYIQVIQFDPAAAMPEPEAAASPA